jgi:hypothetical protein
LGFAGDVVAVWYSVSGFRWYSHLQTYAQSHSSAHRARTKAPTIPN